MSRHFRSTILLSLSTLRDAPDACARTGNNVTGALDCEVQDSLADVTVLIARIPDYIRT